MRSEPQGRFGCRCSIRFDGVCPPTSPAADPQTTSITAGTFISVTFMSGRLPSASEIHTTPIRGNGTAASIRARIRVNISPTPPRFVHVPHITAAEKMLNAPSALHPKAQLPQSSRRGAAFRHMTRSAEVQASLRCIFATYGSMTHSGNKGGMT
jgi:hypothetical protein